MVLGLGVLSNMTMAGREPRRRSCLNSCEVSHNAPSLILGQPCVYDRAVAEGAAACYLLVLSVSNRPVKFIEHSRVSLRTQQLHPLKDASSRQRGTHRDCHQCKDPSVPAQQKGTTVHYMLQLLVRGTSSQLLLTCAPSPSCLPACASSCELLGQDR